MIMLSESSTVVSNEAEFVDALINDNGIDYIYLDDNITLSAGFTISSSKTKFVIDGRYPDDDTGVIHSLTDMASVLPTDTLGIRSASNLQFTLQNISLVGRNYYGIPFVEDIWYMNNLHVTYRNVTYTGPQIAYNPQGYTHFIDCDITINHPNMEEVGEVCKVDFDGVNHIRHSSTGSAAFYFRGTAPQFHLLPGAVLDITTNSYFMYNAVTIFPLSVVYTIDAGAELNVECEKSFSLNQYHQVASLTVGQNAGFRFIRNTAQESSISMYLNGAFTVQSGADVYMQANYARAGALIQFASGSQGLLLYQPDSFVLYNASAPILSFAAAVPVTLYGGQINQWMTATPFPDAGTLVDPPPYQWHKSDWSTIQFSGTASSTVTNITSHNLNSAEEQELPACALLALHNASVFSLGVVPLSIDPIVDNERPITGLSAPAANMMAQYTIDSVARIRYGTADENGRFSIDTSESLPIGLAITVCANRPFLLIYKPQNVIVEGTLELTSVPDEIVFILDPVSVSPVLLPRRTPDQPVVVTDSRTYSTEWELYLSLQNPLRTDDGYILPDAVVFVDDTVRTIGQVPILVYTGGPWTADPEEETKILWAREKGVLARITVPIVCKKEYTTDITWELRKRPEP